MTSLRLLKTTVSILFWIGMLLILFKTHGSSQNRFLPLAAGFTVAWILFFYFVIWRDNHSRALQKLLHSFTYHVDLARQQHGTDSRRVDAAVLKAFDKLHHDVDALLHKRYIRITQVEREVMRFHAPQAPPAGTRWRPPSLSEMGYVLAATQRYTRGGPLLALYKFSGEEHSHAGEVVDAYTILREGLSPSFSGLFDAKVHSPYRVALDTAEVTVAAPAAERRKTPRTDATLLEETDSDHNVAYILSLVGPVTHLNTQVLAENLRAAAALPADTATAPPLSAAAVRAWQRSLLTERIGYLESSLPLARRALRQEPQLLAAALADVYRGGAEDEAALSLCLASLADIVLPQAAHVRPDFVRELEHFALAVQGLEIMLPTQTLQNPGTAYVHACGAEAEATVLRHMAQLLNTAAHNATERVFRVHFFSPLTTAEFHAHMRGFRELNAGAEDQAVIHTLLHSLNEGRLLLHGLDGTQPLKAKELPRPAGHRPSHELFYAANPAALDAHGMDAGAGYVLWTLTGRALHAPFAQVYPLLERALKIKADAATMMLE